MTNLKHTKKALLSSIIALVLCFAMLLGTTYAWFTDSATSSGNKIQAGTLDVELYLWTDANNKVAISESEKPIFGAQGEALVDPIMWEPNATQTVYLSIKNKGNLDLKYKVALDVKNPTDGKDLYEVMEYAITPDATYGQLDNTPWGSGVGVTTGINNAMIGTNVVNDVALTAGNEHFFALSIHMDHEAGNSYIGGSVIFDIKVLAGQLASEKDSTGSNKYDVLASYPGTGFVNASFGTAVNGKKALEEAVEVQITGEHANGENGYKVGSAVLPEGVAFDEDAEGVTVNITKTNYDANINVGIGNEKASFDVSVEGISEDNTVPVKVSLKIPVGLDPETVALYHYNNPIASTYNPNTGYVIFESTTFSPFTVVYDAESVFVPPVVPDEGADEFVAKVTYESQHVNTNIAWGSSLVTPDYSIDPNPQLEAAFKFACPDYDAASPELKAVIDAYKYWYCDFFVSLDRDLGENQIFLGGNYGSFGWLGFHNGDITLEAGSEIALLSSVTVNPWTYDDIANYVGEFICGVGDVNDALNGATFTVKLRLVNPDKVDTSDEGWWANLSEDAYIDVNVVTHTFGAGSAIDGETVVLANDIDLNDPNQMQALQDLINGN